MKGEQWIPLGELGPVPCDGCIHATPMKMEEEGRQFRCGKQTGLGVRWDPPMKKGDDPDEWCLMRDGAWRILT